ncbi:hypothetical protein DER30_6024 [Streptomyces sp. HB202]|nr:hypothetical protein DER30_6024 [Streptomyces sp. HB202]
MLTEPCSPGASSAPEGRALLGVFGADLFLELGLKVRQERENLGRQTLRAEGRGPEPV